MDKLAKNYIESGKDINTLMEMPYNFVLDILAEQTKPDQTESLISAFGG